MILNYPDNPDKQNIVIFARASSDKQVLEGDTLDAQVEQCYLLLDKQEIPRTRVLKEFKFVESGAKARDTRLFFNNMLEFCENPKNRVGLLLFTYVDRLTRKGKADLDMIEQELNEYSIFVQDIKLTFRPKQSTLEYVGFGVDSYDWAVIDPSADAKYAEARNAEMERNKILTRLIGSEMQYAQKGYWVRRSPLGFKNVKVETQQGKRTLLEPHPPESDWIIKIFELKASGTYTDAQIIEKVNSLGFRTREFNQREKGTRRMIGKKGNLPLYQNLLDKIVKRTVYAGIIMEKFTHYEPVKAKFGGLVTIDTFNKANNGKVVIVEVDDSLDVLFNQKPKKRKKYNPMFPYRGYVLCDVCGNPMTASASGGKGGVPRPAYHCSKGHKRFGVKKSEFEKTVEDFANSIEFTEEKKQEINDSVIEVWKEKEADANTEALNKETRIAEIRTEKKQLRETINGLDDNASSLKEDMISDYEKLDKELKELIPQRNYQEREEIEIQKFIEYVQFVMEHPYRILADTVNPIDKGLAFSAFFNTPPKYSDLLNGTPDLKPIYALVMKCEVENTTLVSSLSHGWNPYSTVL